MTAHPETDTMLMTMLEVAVPMQVDAVRSWTPDERIAYCHAHADTIASRADDLMFGSKKRGATAELFNVTARALACMSFQPGGVKLAGRHWESR